MKQPLISVIVATYRHFEGIRETLDSVFFQDYPAMELILVDDGSDDFPEDELKSYIAEKAGKNLLRSVVYTNPENYGTVKSLNIAHGKARGEYSIELAGDDQFYDPHTLSAVVERMEKTGCGAMSMTRYVTDEGGKPLYYYPHKMHRRRLQKLERETQYRMLVTGQFYAALSGSALAFRESVFRELGGYDEKYRLWEDGPFLEKYLRTRKLEMAYDLVAVIYRLGGVSTGNVHPQLKKDGELYDRTDRIARIESLRPFYRKLLLYNIGRGNSGNRVLSLVKNIPVLLYKTKYKLSFQLGEALDKIAFARKNRTEEPNHQ